MLKRGFRRLIRFDSSRSASASVRVVTNSMDRVSDTMCDSRWLCARPCAYCTTRFFRERALPTYSTSSASPSMRYTPGVSGRRFT